MLELTFALFLRTAWCTAILLLLVWSFQKLAGRWLSPRARYALWLLVAARLVILWTPTSSLSLVGQLENRVAGAFSSPSISQTENDLDASAISDTEPIEFTLLTESLPTSADWAPPLSAAPVATWQWSDLPLWSIIAAIWLLGVVVFGAILGRDFWRLRSAIRSMTPVLEARVIQLVRRIEQELAWKKHVRVLVSQEIASPAVTGVFAPALLMPAIFIEKLSDKELEHVIRHELTHVKRRDVLVNWLLAAIGAVYWFFPLMRYLLSQLRKTRELACDAAVLHRASAQERKSYGKTLLKIMEMVSEADRPALTFTVGVAGMVWNIGNFRKESKMMRERLELVVRDRSNRGRAGWLVGAMALVLIAVGFTEAQEKKVDAAGEIVPAAFVARDVDSGSEHRWIESSHDFTSTVKVFEANRRLRTISAPVQPIEAPSPAATNVASKRETIEISAPVAMRAWVERIVKDSGWSDPVEAEISWYEENKATIRHSAQSHERLERALKALHTNSESWVMLELRINSVSAADFVKLDLNGLKTIQTKLAPELSASKGGKARIGSASETISKRPSGQNYLMSDEAMHRIYPVLCGLSSYRSIQAPKLSLPSGQVGQMWSGTSHPFVTKQEFVNRDVEPMVEVLFSGVRSEIQPIALGEKQAWVRWDFQKSELTGMETEKQIETDEVTVQSPQLWNISQSVGAELAAGETLAMFMKLAQPQEDKRDVLAVFLTLREIHVPKDEVESKGAPLTTTTVRTEVLDVSQTPAFRTFAKLTDQDDEMRAKLLGPAYQQLEVLITELIDPESPKVFKRSMENLTLEVTASQEVLEKVNDLIKQLVRLAEKEAEEKSAFVTKTYNIADALIFKAKPVTGPNDSSMDNRLAKAEMRSFIALFKEVNPEFDNPESGRKIEPDFDNLSVTVTGTDQELTSFKDYYYWRKSRIENVASALNIPNPGAEAASQTEGVSDFNLLRMGTEFVPPKNGKPRNQKSSKTKELEEARRAARNNTTVTYDVADFFLLCTTKKEGGKQPDGFDCGNPFAHIFVLLGRVRPDVAPGKDGIELQPFWNVKTLVVSAQPEMHKKIAEVINYMNNLSVEEAKLLIEGNNLSDAIREQEIYFALKQQVEVNFTDKPLAEVLKVLGEAAKINIVVDAAGLVEEGVKSNEPVSLELKKPISLKSALQLILDPLNLDYVVKNEALLITSKRLTKGQPTTVAYDVAGLPFFAGLLEDLKAKREPDTTQRLEGFDKLQTLVKTIPEFAEGKEGFEMQPFYTNLTLVVSAPKETQAQVAMLLKQIERQSLADLEKSIQELKRR